MPFYCSRGMIKCTGAVISEINSWIPWSRLRLPLKSNRTPYERRATLPPPREGAKYCDEYVYVCLSVCSRNSKTTRPNFTNFCCMLPVAVARSSFDDVLICYVLPVLWMTLFFTQWLHGTSCVFLSSRPESVTAKIAASIPTKFCLRGLHTGAKSAIYDRFV